MILIAEEEAHLANVTLVKDIEYEICMKKKHLVRQYQGDLAQVVEPCLPM